MDVCMPPSKNSLNDALYAAAQDGDAALLASLIEQGADPADGLFRALRVACHMGRVECARLLAPLSDATCLSSQALSLAAAAGHVECVKILLPLSDARGSEFKALSHAANENQHECVALLLAAGWDQSPFLARILTAAAAEGRFESVAALANASSADACQAALASAAEHGRAACVKLLLSKSSQKDFAWHRINASCNAARNGHLECCALFASECASESAGPMAIAAASFGRAEILRLLLSLPELSREDRAEALVCAAHGGHLACAEALFSIPNFMARPGAPLRGAILSGNARLVEAMLAYEPRCADALSISLISRRKAGDEIANILAAFAEARAISLASSDAPSQKSVHRI